MFSLRPHRKFDFVKYWKYGFRLSGALIALALIGFVVSTVMTGAPLTLGTEFSGGTSIQINDAGSVTEEELKDAFAQAAGELGFETQISSVQTSDTSTGGHGYIVKTTDTISTNASDIMKHVEENLGIDNSTVEIETIGASWGASVIWSSIIAFLLSCVGILVVIAVRYREPRMGVVALACLFHDMIVVLGIYAWAGLFFHMEITSDVIAALLAIIGYSLYDTVVVFHRISRNASPQMKCNLYTCANQSLNEVIVRSVNTSITSIIPVLFMLILGTDTLLDFAFAMFCGMIVGVYSTLAISAPLYTMWKAKEPAYVRLDQKYPYEVVQPAFTKQMMLEAREETAERLKVEEAERKEQKAQEREERERARQEELERSKEEARAAEAKRKQEALDAKTASSAADLAPSQAEDDAAPKYDASTVDAVAAIVGTSSLTDDEDDDDVFITLEAISDEYANDEVAEDVSISADVSAASTSVSMIDDDTADVEVDMGTDASAGEGDVDGDPSEGDAEMLNQ